MKCATWALAFALAVLGMCATVGSAAAQASRTWVSGLGDDANPCSRTAPCKTFAGAISKTQTLGEINCLDPSGYGTLTITKSITIDCHAVFGSILNAGTNGIVINFDSFTDARKTVRIRNLNFNGFDTGLIGIRIISTGASSAGSAVMVEDCLIDGNFGGTGSGISDERVGGGELYVTNTTARNMGGNAFAVAPASGSTRIDAVFDTVRGENGATGIAAGAGTKVIIVRSTFSGNTIAGISVTNSEVNVQDTVSSSNGVGVQINSGTVRLSNSDIDFNTTGVTGTVYSFGNSRISGNTTAGTTPGLIGFSSSAFGQE